LRQGHDKVVHGQSCKIRACFVFVLLLQLPPLLLLQQLALGAGSRENASASASCTPGTSAAGTAAQSSVRARTAGTRGGCGAGSRNWITMGKIGHFWPTSLGRAGH